MPVVTIDPSQLDTTTFELEEIDTVHFTITNHGLIRADNLRFSMPTGHPSLNFKSVSFNHSSIINQHLCPNNHLTLSQIHLKISKSCSV